eukprot:scaffold13387_cov129-Isochrysis_galbana.AAC.1
MVRKEIPGAPFPSLEDDKRDLPRGSLPAGLGSCSASMLQPDAPAQLVMGRCDRHARFARESYLASGHRPAVPTASAWDLAPTL